MVNPTIIVGNNNIPVFCSGSPTIWWIRSYEINPILDMTAEPNITSTAKRLDRHDCRWLVSTHYAYQSERLSCLWVARTAHAREAVAPTYYLIATRIFSSIKMRDSARDITYEMLWGGREVEHDDELTVVGYKSNYLYFLLHQLQETFKSWLLKSTDIFPVIHWDSAVSWSNNGF